MRPYANHLKNISGGAESRPPPPTNNEILDSRLIHQCEIPTQQKGVDEKVKVMGFGEGGGQC